MIIEYTGKTPEAKIKTLAESVQLALNTIEAQSLQPGAIGKGTIGTVELVPRVTAQINSAYNTAQSTAYNLATNYADREEVQQMIVEMPSGSKIYYQTTMPTGGEYKVGDTWFDTDDGYKIYKYDGSSWEATQFGTNAIANTSITGNKIATGTITANQIAAYTITASQIATGAISADKIAAGAITTIGPDSSYQATMTSSGFNVNVGDLLNCNISASGMTEYYAGSGRTSYFYPDLVTLNHISSPYIELSLSAQAYSSVIHWWDSTSGPWWRLKSGSGGGLMLDTVGAGFLPSDNTLTLGSSTYKWGHLYLTDKENISSDRRLKKNIEPLNESYDSFFDKLEPVKFNMIGDDSLKIHLGFIAQDVEQALADSGLDEKNHLIVDDGEDTKDEYVTSPTYGLCYDDFIPILVKEIQQLKARVAELEANNGGN